MSYIGKNIKKIRTVKKLSQAAFADMFNLARPSVGAYEEGRSEPKIDTIIAIANQFSLSTDALLRKELTVNELYSLNILKGDFDPTSMPPVLGKTSTGSSKIAYPSQNKDAVPLVEKNLVFEYIVNLGNRDFIGNLKSISLPTHSKGILRAFEHHSDEMYHSEGGLRDGDILLCKLVEKGLPKKLKPEAVFVVVMQTGIYTRRIIHIDEQRIQFRVDNPAYEDLTVNRSEVLEIWEVCGVWSTIITEPAMIEQRLMKLENLVAQLEKRIKS